MAAPSPTRTDLRRERTRSALLGAARRLFAKRSPATITIQEITDAADVAKGSFYNHFESREALEHAVVASALEEMAAAIDRELAGHETDPARVIARSLHTTLRTCLENPALGAFVAQHPEMLQVGSGVGERGRRDLARGMATGRFRIDDVEATLTMLVGAGQALLRARLSDTLDRRAEAHFLRMVLRMLGVADDDASAIADETTNAEPGSAI